MEFIGTFFLVLVIALSKNPVTVAGVLMVMVYVGANISGSHFNPAVSTALYLQKKLDSMNLAKYILAQVLGAMAAAAMYVVLTKANFYVAPSENVGFWTAVLAEVLFTFALCTTVLQTAVSEKAKGNSYFGLAIGAVVGVAGLSIGPISGAALNPAVGIGPLLIDFNLLSSVSSNVGLYLLGPLAGAVLASLVYSYTNKR